MALKVNEFCPVMERATLLRFRQDAFFAWLNCPLHQETDWLSELYRICELLEQTRAITAPL